MKFIFLLLVLASSPVSLARAEDPACLLSEPVPFRENELLSLPPGETQLFTAVETNIAPRFAEEVPGPVSLHLFPIYHNGAPLKMLGAFLMPESNEFVGFGFSPQYVNLPEKRRPVTKIEIADGVETRTTEMHGYYTSYANDPDYAGCTECREGPSLDRTVLRVRDGNIISIELTAPVEKVWKKENNGMYTYFTGEHQTLCVRKVKL